MESVPFDLALAARLDRWSAPKTWCFILAGAVLLRLADTLFPGLGLGPRYIPAGGDSIRRYGGLDYLVKPVDQPRLLAAVREGAAWSVRRRVQIERTARLSPRERDVFALLVKGLQNEMIAHELGLSTKTIEDHRAQFMSKTGATSVAQLIALAES